MRPKKVLGGMALAVAVGAVACGGSTSNSLNASSGGTAGQTGNDAGAGGPSGGSGASGGFGGSSTGGAMATGGSAGSPSCAGPASSTAAALCLKFAPEAMTFLNERDLDGRGVLIVEVYDTPTPDNPDGGTGALPIADRVFPNQPGDGGTAEVSVTALPVVRFDDLPAGKVYVRTFFVDNPAALNSNNLSWGVWVGGVDLSNGLRGSLPIAPITLSAGHAKSVTQALTALRRLRVALSLASGTTPLDDGQGPVRIGAWRTTTPTMSSPLSGYGRDACVDVSAGPAIVPAVLVGSGTFYLSADLDDFNVGGSGSTGPGILESLAFTGGVVSLPAENAVTVGATQYSVEHAVQLNYVSPLGSGGAPPAYSCVVDAGTP